jgi:cation transporter-like permease
MGRHRAVDRDLGSAYGARLSSAIAYQEHSRIVADRAQNGNLMRW